MPTCWSKRGRWVSGNTACTPFAAANRSLVPEAVAARNRCKPDHTKHTPVRERVPCFSCSMCGWVLPPAPAPCLQRTGWGEGGAYCCFVPPPPSPMILPFGAHVRATSPHTHAHWLGDEMPPYRVSFVRQRRGWLIELVVNRRQETFFFFLSLLDCFVSSLRACCRGRGVVEVEVEVEQHVAVGRYLASRRTPDLFCVGTYGSRTFFGEAARREISRLGLGPHRSGDDVI